LVQVEAPTQPHGRRLNGKRRVSVPVNNRRMNVRRKIRLEPGDIIRYRGKPRHRGEILCHNMVIHYPETLDGARGFRYFVCTRGGGWGVCPCGWQPPSGWKGVHYADPAHVKWWRKNGLKKLRAARARGDTDPFGLYPLVKAAKWRIIATGQGH